VSAATDSREVGQLGAFQDLVYEDGGPAVQLSEVRPIRHQAARLHLLTYPLVYDPSAREAHSSSDPP
jgi:hypothetical protein